MTEMRTEIDVAANLVFLAVLSVNVHVVFRDGVTRNRPEMRHRPFSDQRRVPVETGTTNEVNATLRDRFTLVALTVKPAWAVTAVAVVLWVLEFAPTTYTSYLRPFTRPVNEQLVDVVVQVDVPPSTPAV